MATSSYESLSVMCEQVFSRKSLGYVWSKRNEIDPGQMVIIGALYNNRKKGSIEGSVCVEYKLARGLVGKLGYGRLYGTRGSLETLEREIRGTLCEEFYHDIDVKNAHPVILHQFAKSSKYNREMPAVKKYCDNRDACLNAISANRDEAKTAFLKVMYGGKCEYPFLADYEKEVSSFARMLANQEEHAELVKHLRKQDKNLYASLLALILQTEERKIMLAMKASLEKQGWSVDVLAYDGVMIRKKPELKLTDEMLRQVERDILSQTDYAVELVDKAFDSYEVPADVGEVAPKVSKEDYQKTKMKFEENHFYYSPTNTIAEINKEGTLSFYSLEHAATKLNGFDFKHSKTSIMDRTAFLPLWLKDSERRTYSKIDQKPSDDIEVYSPPVTFKYMEGKPKEDGTEIIECFKDLVGLAAGRDEGIAQFIIHWFAHLLQKPFENPLSAVILTGQEGCGKDTIGDFFCEWMLGDIYSHNYTSTKQFWEKHDTGRFGKFFVKLEEANGYLNRQNIGDMKAIITSRTLSINPKGEKPLTTANYNRFFMTTNEGCPVKVEEGSRRFMVSACSAEKIGNIAYWKKVRATLFNAEGAATVGKYLMNLDLSNFETTVFPENPYLQQIKDNEKSAEQRFLEQWDGEMLSIIELHNLYVSFCADNVLQSVSLTGFGYKLLVPVRDKKLFKKVIENKAHYSKVPM
jgi:hypothetical protein